MTGQRCQLARINRFVEREENDREIGIVAVPGQQRLQRMHEIGAAGHVGTLVAPEAREHRRIVVAERTGVDLHHQAILRAHRRHLGEHLRTEQLGIGGGDIGADHPREQRLSLGRRQVRGLRGRVAVIGRGRPMPSEEGAALAVRGEIAGPAEHILAGQLAEPDQIVAKALEFGIDHRIGAIGGEHAPLPARCRDGLVMLERVERRFGGGDHLDAEPFEQRARAEFGGGEARRDVVVIMVGGAGIELDIQPEGLGEDPVEPHPRGRAPEQMIVPGQDAPGLARIDRRCGSARHRCQPKRFQRNSLAVEHAEHVMVRLQQQRGRILERRIAGEPGRIGMAMRADDRQITDRVIKPPRDRADMGVDREKPVGVKL